MFKRNNGEYILRSVTPASKAVTVNEILSTDPVTLIIDEESLSAISHCVMFEDLLASRHEHRDVTKQYFKQLTELLSGRSEHWKLWEAIINRTGIKFHYFDLRDPRRRSRRLTSLACYIPWHDPVKLKLLVPSRDGKPFMCEVSYNLESKKGNIFHALRIEYILDEKQCVDQYSRRV